MDFQIQGTPYPIGCWIVDPQLKLADYTVDEPGLTPNRNPVAFAGARLDSMSLGRILELDEAVSAALGVTLRRSLSLPIGERLEGFFARFLGGSTVQSGALDRGVSVQRFGRTYHPAEGSVRTESGQTIEFYALIDPNIDQATLADLARGQKYFVCSLIGPRP